jgi:hypothetical protein
MGGNQYHYRFDFPEGRTLEFDVDTSAPPKTLENPPKWVELGHRQCGNCPLDSATHRYCPAAMGLVHVIEPFESVDSTEKVTATVTNQRRIVHRSTDVQTALRSLIGLLMPISGCPILGRLRGLTTFHLPFSDRDETVFRVVSSYLLQQYLVELDGGEPDWKLQGMRTLYEDLQQVDTAFADRMRSAMRGDAGVNALVALFSLAALVSMSVDEDLARIRERMLT